MNKLILSGIAAGSSGILAVGAALVAISPFDTDGTEETSHVASAPDFTVPVTPTSPVDPVPTSTDPGQAIPDRKSPSAATPGQEMVGRVDQATAADLVRDRFPGARVVEVERDDGSWELTFLLHGVENEVHVDPRTGRLFDHEVDDDRDYDDD